MEIPSDALAFLQTQVKNVKLRQLLAAVASDDLSWLEVAGHSLMYSSAYPDRVLQPMREELERLSLASHLVLSVGGNCAGGAQRYWLCMHWQPQGERWVQLHLARRWLSTEEAESVGYCGNQQSGMVESDPAEALRQMRELFLGWMGAVTRQSASAS